MRRFALLLPLAIAGCAVGPDYERPQVPLPRSMGGEAAVSSSASSSSPRFTTGEPDARWWTLFGDPALEDLVGRALAGNPGLEAAVARVATARAVALRSRSPLIPDVSANGDYLYEKASRNTTGFSASRRTRPFAPSDFFRGTLDMTYELDLWGRMRREVESQEALAVASDEDRKTAEITLVADVCEAWFDLGEAEAALALARETVEVRARSLDLVRARFEAGVIQELDLRRAESELEGARAELPEAERRRAVALHRLGVLTGRPADLELSGKPPAAFVLPPEVPLGVPSSLLERRPDIRAAELRVVSANAAIGEAIARFFPRVMIVGQAGAATLDAKNAFLAGSTLWSIGPSVHLPILELGSTWALELEKEARTREAVALYREAILRAFGEVADALAGLVAHGRVRDHQALAAEKAARGLELAEARYAQGAIAYLEVLDAQRALVGARLALLGAQRAVLSDFVRLEKALGGGWSTSSPR